MNLSCFREEHAGRLIFLSERHGDALKIDHDSRFPKCRRCCRDDKLASSVTTWASKQ